MVIEHLKKRRVSLQNEDPLKSNYQMAVCPPVARVVVLVQPEQNTSYNGQQLWPRVLRRPHPRPNADLF